MWTARTSFDPCLYCSGSSSAGSVLSGKSSCKVFIYNSWGHIGNHIIPATLSEWREVEKYPLKSRRRPIETVFWSISTDQDLPVAAVCVHVAVICVDNTCWQMGWDYKRPSRWEKSVQEKVSMLCEDRFLLCMLCRYTVHLLASAPLNSTTFCCHFSEPLRSCSVHSYQSYFRPSFLQLTFWHGKVCTNRRVE